jgi:ABC-type glycerol-3-phosphate transport system substrate-binding protein
VKANYSQAWQDLGTVDGKLYGVWYKAANKSTVWYRTDLFKDAGITQPPADWDTFIKDAQSIADQGIAPIAIGGADGWTLTDWFENVYLRTAGPDMYDQLTKHEIPWTDPSVKTALKMLGDLWGNQQLISGGTTQALQDDMTKSVIRAFSKDDLAAIVYEGDFVAGVITGNTDFKLGDTADFFPVPSINGSQPAVTGGGDVAVALKSNPGAFGLLQFLASPEAAEVWAPLGGYTSPNQHVDPSKYPDDVTRRTSDQLVKASTFRFDMSDLAPAAFGATEGQGEWGIMQQFLQNPTNVDGISQQLEDAAKTAYGA